MQWEWHRGLAHRLVEHRHAEAAQAARGQTGIWWNPRGTDATYGSGIAESSCSPAEKSKTKEQILNAPKPGARRSPEVRCCPVLSAEGSVSLPLGSTEATTLLIAGKLQPASSRPCRTRSPAPQGFSQAPSCSHMDCITHPGPGRGDGGERGWKEREKWGSPPQVSSEVPPHSSPSATTRVLEPKSISEMDESRGQSVTGKRLSGSLRQPRRWWNTHGLIV